MSTLEEWAHTWAISPAALADLAARLGARALPPLEPVAYRGRVGDEAYVQMLVRRTAAERGILLFRNNVGALLDDESRPVRYGLANDSKKLNEVLKSGDLIGIQRYTVTPLDVGKVLGLFWSAECKKADWVWTGTPRELAQKNWADLIISYGGRAVFATGPSALVG